MPKITEDQHQELTSVAGRVDWDEQQLTEFVNEITGLELSSSHDLSDDTFELVLSALRLEVGVEDEDEDEDDLDGVYGGIYSEEDNGY